MGSLIARELRCRSTSKGGEKASENNKAIARNI